MVSVFVLHGCQCSSYTEWQGRIGGQLNAKPTTDNRAMGVRQSKTDNGRPCNGQAVSSPNQQVRGVRRYDGTNVRGGRSEGTDSWWRRSGRDSEYQAMRQLAMRRLRMRWNASSGPSAVGTWMVIRTRRCSGRSSGSSGVSTVPSFEMLERLKAGRPRKKNCSTHVRSGQGQGVRREAESRSYFCRRRWRYLCNAEGEMLVQSKGRRRYTVGVVVSLSHMLLCGLYGTVVLIYGPHSIPGAVRKVLAPVEIDAIDVAKGVGAFGGAVAVPPRSRGSSSS